MKEKVCTKCNKLKPIESFTDNPNRLGGKGPHCRSCRQEYDASPHGRVKRFFRNVKRDVKKAEQKYGITVEDNLKSYDVAMVQGDDECAYCGKQLEAHEVTIDHVRPFKQGGANDFRNLLPCCLSCNARKGDKTLYEFLIEHVDEYHFKKVVFTLSQRYGITYAQMEEQLKLDRVFNMYGQSWQTIQKEGLTHLFKDKDDFENKRRTYQNERT